MAAVREVTICGDNAPPIQTTMNAAAVPSLVKTTRSVRWPAPAERKIAIAVRYMAGPPHNCEQASRWLSLGGISKRNRQGVTE
jgi:hypothetical protein